VTADFVARLGSRASDPGEVRTAWGIAEYVAAMAGTPDPPVLDQVGRLDRARLHALLRAMARPPSAELNKARLAAAAGIPPTTITPYVETLARLGVVRLLPGTASPLAKRPVARPRVLFDDPALARELSGAEPADLEQMGGRARLAPLLEGMAIVALLRQQATSAVDFRLTHLRERNGLAVDLLVELPDDTVYGIDIRTAGGFRPHQFRALEALATRAGSRFRGGIVLNTAPTGFKYRPGMWVLPLSSLWEWE
jgi:predicted AAA+ superfamily ATPase